MLFRSGYASVAYALRAAFEGHALQATSVYSGVRFARTISARSQRGRTV